MTWRYETTRMTKQHDDDDRDRQDQVQGAGAGHRQHDQDGLGSVGDRRQGVQRQRRQALDRGDLLRRRLFGSRAPDRTRRDGTLVMALIGPRSGSSARCGLGRF